MSHEIRTPMNAILGYAQLLRRDRSLGGAQRDKLDAILTSGVHLLEAGLRARPALIHAVAQRIESFAGDAAARIHELAEDFRYDDLTAALEPQSRGEAGARTQSRGEAGAKR
ncbi:MAG: hypothetical protein RL685_2237 [Pseudomonadota bacterium]|jgi:signal transduction histidine kinase